MKEELAYAMITPYSLFKSRTGGIISRLLSRPNLNFVGARMFVFSDEFIDEYKEAFPSKGMDPIMEDAWLDYIDNHLRRDNPYNMLPRCIILLFKCENAVYHIKDKVIGSFTKAPVGNTIRGTFGDCIQDENGKIHYLEPAVLTGADTDKNLIHLRLFAKYAKSDGGLLTGMIDYGSEPETTLVLIKPDNFYMPSRRPGNIIDTFSLTGLRIVGTKLFSMTVSQGEEFYGHLKDVFREKLKFKVSDVIYESLCEKFGFCFTKQDADMFADHLADRNAVCEFNRIVEYMTGVNPESVSEEEKNIATNAKCLALAYEGVGAINKVREVLGATNPEQAAPGTVRSDFGRDLMRNGAHASDSAENAQREMRIIGLTKDSGTCEFSEIINEYLENR